MSLGSSVNSDVQVAAIPGWRAKVCFCLNRDERGSTRYCLKSILNLSSKFESSMLVKKFYVFVVLLFVIILFIFREVMENREGGGPNVALVN